MKGRNEDIPGFCFLIWIFQLVLWLYTAAIYIDLYFILSNLWKEKVQLYYKIDGKIQGSNERSIFVCFLSCKKTGTLILIHGTKMKTHRKQIDVITIGGKTLNFHIQHSISKSFFNSACLKSISIKVNQFEDILPTMTSKFWTVEMFFMRFHCWKLHWTL